jgi:hypothetical protein
MFTSFNVTVVALWTNTVGSNVMVNDPITGLTGALARKPVAVKLMVSVIIAAFAGPAPRASTQAAAIQPGSAFIAVLPLNLPLSTTTCGERSSVFQAS